MFGGIAAVDGVEDFVRLFDGEGFQGFKRLFLVPRAALFGPERGDNIEQAGERRGVSVGRCGFYG